MLSLAVPSLAAAGAEIADPPKCAVVVAFSPAGSNWNGWGNDPRNWRLQRRPGLNRNDVPRLKVKWAMTYTGGRYGQPTVVGGRLFLTSAGGRIYSLDAESGCLFWRFDAPAGARSTVVIGRLQGAPSGFAAYFGDLARNVYALDAGSGRLLWKVSVSSYPHQIITGSLALDRGRLYVPLSSNEEMASMSPAYPCCTAQGGVVALDARSGRVVWKTSVIGQSPHPTRVNASGVQMFGPAGAAVWSTPTVDDKRGVLYVGTGGSYTDVAEDASDAIVAIDLATGAVRWKQQVTRNDTFLPGCAGPQPGANCPKVVGPNADIGGSPILLSLPRGGDIVAAGQKSGMVYALDPDRAGRILWRTRVGAGGPLGGVEWGMATDGRRLYVANADATATDGSPRPALLALDPASGRILWSTPAPKVACGWSGRGGCFNAQSAAPSVIPGLVLATTTDGNVRAYEAFTGRIVWDVDTAGRTYATINGVAKQTGGSLDVAGPVLAGGMAFLISGYQGPMGGVPDNVLLAFSVDGR